MPTGIVLASGSIGSKQEDTIAVLEKHGYEVPKPEPAPAAEPVEPKREDFKTEEEFAAAQGEFEEKQAEAEAAAEEQEQKKQAAQKPHLSRIQKRIAKETSKLSEQLRQANERIAALEGQGKKPPVEAPKPPEAPKREAFKSDEEFQEALFDYRYKLRRAKEDAEAQKTALEDYQKEMVQNYVSAKDQIKEEYADWEELMEKFGEQPVSPSIYTTILRLEEGPRVVYYLAQHPDKLQELNAMFPDEAMVEVVRLHDRLKTSKGKPGASEIPAPKPKPKAIPAPVRPIAASASAATLTAADAAKAKDFSAFKAARRAGR